MRRPPPSPPRALRDAPFHDTAPGGPVTARLLRATAHACGTLGLKRGDRLLLAVSGGADSLALAALLARLAPARGWELRALSVNHGLRPEAAADAAHAAGVCQRLGIPCRVALVDVPALRLRGEGVEEAARRLRYAALEEERRRCRAAWIALGHHAGDATEDMLLRLLRGTGWPALGGMRARDGERRLLRPLLGVTPDMLRACLRALGIDWVEDGSNKDTRLTRNRIRHSLLPLMREENPALDAALGRLRALAALDADYWDDLLDAALAAQPWEDSGTDILLPRALLRPLHPAARLRLFHHAARTLALRHGGQARHDALAALERAYIEGRGGLVFQFPGSLSATLRKGTVRFSVVRTAKKAGINGEEGGRRAPSGAQDENEDRRSEPHPAGSGSGLRRAGPEALRRQREETPSRRPA